MWFNNTDTASFKLAYNTFLKEVYYKDVGMKYFVVLSKVLSSDFVDRVFLETSGFSDVDVEISENLHSEIRESLRLDFEHYKQSSVKKYLLFRFERGKMMFEKLQINDYDLYHKVIFEQVIHRLCLIRLARKSIKKPVCGVNALFRSEDKKKLQFMLMFPERYEYRFVLSQINQLYA